MIYKFGAYEVDTRLLELRRDGQPQPIDPLGFDLLSCLIENRDRVLTRDELLDTLWPGKVVTDSALSSRLKNVRSAVGDTGAAQQVIKTVHGRGYRFVADLVENATENTGTVEQYSASLTPHAVAVGRDTELGKLTRWLDRAASGDRTMVFVAGDAGVGKTTLIRAFLQSIQSQPDTFILHGQCVHQHGSHEAYLPLLEALGRAGQHNGVVTDALRGHAPAWLAQLPALEGNGNHNLSGPIGATAGRMLRELSDALEQLARKKKLVLVLEDLHWCDPSTLVWLDYYARRSDRARLILLASFRPDGCPAQTVCSELAARGHAHYLPLESIDEADVSDYLNTRLDHPPTAGLAAITYRRTGGFPLFIETLVEHWLNHGLIKKTNGTWSAVSDDATLLAGIPDNLALLIDQQLDNLGDTERTLLETAALVGSPFAAAAVAWVLEEAEEQIEALFGRCARQGNIIRNSGEMRWPDGTITSTFEFRHELYREALAARVAAARGARLHHAIGVRLEQAFGTDAGAVAGQIADHFARAHDIENALRHFFPAARSAFNRSAYRETVAIANRALELAANHDLQENEKHLERELLLLRGSSLISLEGWASKGVEESYTRALAIGDALGVDDVRTEIYNIAAMHENRGRYASSQAVIESLLERGTDVGVEGHELLACSLFHQGRFAQSIANADQAVEHYDPEHLSNILARYGENPGVSCHNWAACALVMTGFPDTAVARSDMALKMATGHIYSRCSALTLRVFIHQFRNEPAVAADWCRRALEIAESQGFDYRVSQTLVLGGWARGLLSADESDQHAALGDIDEGIRRHLDIGSEMDLPYYLTLKAALLAHMGQPDTALEVQKQALASNPAGRPFFYTAEMLRQQAELLQASESGSDDRVANILEQGLTIARLQDARWLELRICITRCQLAGDAGAELLQDLGAALAQLSEGQQSVDWQTAQDIIRRAHVQPSAKPRQADQQRI